MNAPSSILTIRRCLLATVNAFHALAPRDGRLSRTRFLRNLLVLASAKVLIDPLLVDQWPDLLLDRSWALSWLNPLRLIGSWYRGEAVHLIALTTVLCSALVTINAARRARDAGWPTWIAAITALPFVHILALIALALPPTRRRSVWDLV